MPLKGTPTQTMYLWASHPWQPNCWTNTGLCIHTWSWLIESNRCAKADLHLYKKNTPLVGVWFIKNLLPKSSHARKKPPQIPFSVQWHFIGKCSFYWCCLTVHLYREFSCGKLGKLFIDVCGPLRESGEDRIFCWHEAFLLWSTLNMSIRHWSMLKSIQIRVKWQCWMQVTTI